MIVTVKTTNKECRELLSILDKAKIKYFLPRNIESKWVVIERNDEDKTYELIKDCSEIESVSYHNPYPYELISRHFINNQILKFPAVDFSDKNFVLIAGPCSIENSQQCEKVASMCENNHLHFFRGGAYKMRTSPYDFQGLGEEGLKILENTCKKHHLYSVSEIVSTDDIDKFKNVDIIQIGARNMQNYDLLKKVAALHKVVLLKRGFGAKINEFLYSAEYLMLYGAEYVILCERGIRTFDDETRFTLDLGMVSYLKTVTYLPIIVDPSHASGRRDLVESMTMAAMAGGAHGAIIEVHPDPDKALSDGKQSLTLEGFEILKKKLDKLGKAIDDGKNVL